LIPRKGFSQLFSLLEKDEKLFALSDSLISQNMEAYKELAK